MPLMSESLRWGIRMGRGEAMTWSSGMLHKGSHRSWKGAAAIGFLKVTCQRKRQELSWKVLGVPGLVCCRRA